MKKKRSKKSEEIQKQVDRVFTKDGRSIPLMNYQKKQKRQRKIATIAVFFVFVGILAFAYLVQTTLTPQLNYSCLISENVSVFQNSYMLKRSVSFMTNSSVCDDSFVQQRINEESPGWFSWIIANTNRKVLDENHTFCSWNYFVSFLNFTNVSVCKKDAAYCYGEPEGCEYIYNASFVCIVYDNYIRKEWTDKCCARLDSGNMVCISDMGDRFIGSEIMINGIRLKDCVSVQKFNRYCILSATYSDHNED